jgi:hypothetical protein
MMARDRRYGKGSVKTRVGIATALLVGGAVAAGAVVASSHGVASTATSAAYSSGYSSEGTLLNSAMNDWSWSSQSSYSQLARLTQARTFSQTWDKGKMLAVQRGIVVLVTHKFLILRSANGSLHLWLLSGQTKIKNVSSTRAGMQALTADTDATQQAMDSGNMIPATTMLAGSPTTAAALLTPTTAPQTVTVQVANTSLTVTVTVTRSTATVYQTATTSLTGLPRWSRVRFTQDAWMPVNHLARGDLALVVGTRSHWTLKAQLILFTPLSTSDVSGGDNNGSGDSSDNSSNDNSSSSSSNSNSSHGNTGSNGNNGSDVAGTSW